MHFLSSVTEYNYMTQVVLMVYEDSRTTSTKQGTDRFHIELLFSPGLYPCFLTEKERIYETRFPKSISFDNWIPVSVACWNKQWCFIIFLWSSYPLSVTHYMKYLIHHWFISSWILSVFFFSPWWFWLILPSYNYIVYKVSKLIILH